jgi:excisionase family DNA binding protein
VADGQGVNVRTVYNWVKSGRITGYRVGHRVWIDMESVSVAFEPKLIGGGR